MKPLIRHHQNLLQMTNRRDCRKSIESSPGTTFPPYHNFYSIGEHFSEDRIVRILSLINLRKSVSLLQVIEFRFLASERVFSRQFDGPSSSALRG